MRAFLPLVAHLLSRGVQVRFRALGSSMHPTARSGELVGVEPLGRRDARPGDILLYRAGLGVFAHRVLATEAQSGVRERRRTRPAGRAVSPLTVIRSLGRSLLPATVLAGLAVLAAVEPANAQVTLVQKKTGTTGSGTSVSATFDSPPTLNNLLVAIVGNRASSTPTTPSGWSVAISETSNSPGQVIYYKIAGASEASAVTVNYTVVTALALQLYEYSGISTSSPLDQTGSSSGTSASVSSGSITTTSDS